MSAPLAAAAGLLGDRLFGEPPARWHPVVAFGSCMGTVEKANYADTRLRGLVHTGIGTLLAGTAGLALAKATSVSVAASVGSAIAVAGRALGTAAASVGNALDAGDLELARERLPALVGRDPSGLDESEVARAVVESVAENTVDAIVAPALWAAALGAPGALAYRAVNTMDSMVGHRSERLANYGWASARLDDAANWVPARATALMVAGARPRSAKAIWAAVRDDAPGHPSPNAGVAEAAFAAALGLSLGGDNRYEQRFEQRARLGHGRPACRDDIHRAVRLSNDVTVLLAGLLVAFAVGRRQ